MSWRYLHSIPNDFLFYYEIWFNHSHWNVFSCVWLWWNNLPDLNTPQNLLPVWTIPYSYFLSLFPSFSYFPLCSVHFIPTQPNVEKCQWAGFSHWPSTQIDRYSSLNWWNNDASAKLDTDFIGWAGSCAWNLQFFWHPNEFRQSSTFEVWCSALKLILTCMRRKESTTVLKNTESFGLPGSALFNWCKSLLFFTSMATGACV